jgi:CBS domain-containing protein
MDDFDDDLQTGAATERVGDDPVERFMGDSIAMIEPTASLRAAAERLRSAEVGLIVVGTVEAVQGVVSERDIVRAVAHGVDLDNTTVESIESEDLKWATRETSVADVIEEMMEHYLRHVLIAGDDGQLVGVASMRELVAAYLD